MSRITIAFLSLLGLIILLIVVAIALPKVDKALVYDPQSDKALEYFAYIFMGFCAVGLLCIFWEAIRIPVGVALGVYFLAFIVTIVCFKGYEKIAYMQHKNDYPVVRNCEVTKHEFEIEKRTVTDKDADGYVRGEREISKVKYYMTLQFEDEEKAYEFDCDSQVLPFYDDVRLGDKALAKCVYVGKLLFIVGLDKIDN